jgi:flagellin-specific chaperone FliS
MLNRLIPIAFGALLVVSCSEDANIPTEDTTATVVGTEDQSFPGRGQLIERLEAEGDAETQVLLEQAREARTAAKAAFQAGDREAAHDHAREARSYIHQAIERTFPELAERMEQRKAERGDSGVRHGRHWAGVESRQEAMSRLRADADEEATALLDQASAARMAAKEAYQAGNEEEAKRQMQKAREAMHEAITRIDPEMAARIEARGKHRTERRSKTRQP